MRCRATRAHNNPNALDPTTAELKLARGAQLTAGQAGYGSNGTFGARPTRQLPALALELPCRASFAPCLRRCWRWRARARHSVSATSAKPPLPRSRAGAHLRARSRPFVAGRKLQL